MDAKVYRCLQQNPEALLGAPGPIRMNARRKEILLGNRYLGTDAAIAIIQRRAGLLTENLRCNKDGVITVKPWPVEVVRTQLLSLATQNLFDPVLDYLSGLKTWDGVDRIPSVMTALRLKDRQPLHEAFVRKTTISAVARASDPGCKVDTMLVFHAEKGGELKSSFFRALFGDEFFSDDCIDIESKDSWMQINRFWCIEWTEMEALKSARSREAIKAFLSRQTDTYRAPYAHDLETHPRASVFVGTTNPGVILENDGGNRRFWIVPNVGAIDLATVRSMRDQIWAQAVAAYQRGDIWWLTPEEEAQREDLQQEHIHEELGAEAVERWIASRERVTVEEILTQGPEVFRSGAFQSKRGQMSVARILRALGWEKQLLTVEGRRTRFWQRTAQAAKASPRARFGKLIPIAPKGDAA